MKIEVQIIHNDGKVALTHQREYRAADDLDRVVNEATTAYRQKFYGENLEQFGFNILVSVVSGADPSD